MEEIEFSYTAPGGKVMAFKLNKERFQAEINFNRLLHLCLWNFWNRTELMEDMEAAGVSIAEFLEGIDQGRKVSEILKLKQQ